MFKAAQGKKTKAREAKAKALLEANEEKKT